MSTATELNSLPENLLEQWDDGIHIPFESDLSWFKALSEHVFNRPENNRYIYSEIGDSTVLLPLHLKSESFLGVKARVAQSMSNYYTSLFDITCMQNSLRDKDTLSTHLNNIFSELETDIIQIEPLATTSLNFDLIINTLNNQGYKTFPYFRFGNWYIELNGRSFGEYCNVLPSQTKNTIKRKEKKLLKEPTYELYIAQSESEVQEALKHYEKIYALSWKEAEPYPQFVRDIALNGAKKGFTRLGISMLNGEPAAAQLWFVKNNYCSIFKLAYDPKYKKQSAGSVLTYRMMEHVIDVDGATTVDYLIGDDPYKQSWMTHRRERWGIIACNQRSYKGIVHTIRHSLSEILGKINSV